MTYTIYFDKGRRMVIVEKERLLDELERLMEAGHVISSVQ